MEMPGLAMQPRCLRQYPDRHRAVLGRHSAHRAPVDQGGTGTETTSLERRGQPGRAATDDHHIDSLPGCHDSDGSDRRADRGDRATGRKRHCMTTETITLGERRILFVALTRARRHCAVALPTDTAPSTVQASQQPDSWVPGTPSRPQGDQGLPRVPSTRAGET